MGSDVHSYRSTKLRDNEDEGADLEPPHLRAVDGVRGTLLDPDRPSVAEAPPVDEPTAAPRVPYLVAAGEPRSERLQYLLEGPGWATLRLAGDLLATCIAVALGLLTATHSIPLATAASSLFAFPLVAVMMIHVRGLYSRSLRMKVLDAVAPLAGAVSLAAMVLLTWDILVAGDESAGSTILRVWLFAVPLVLAIRAGLVLLQQKYRCSRTIDRKSVV